VRSWSFRFRDPKSGSVTRATLGKYPDVSLSDARDKANELRRSVALGLNPTQEKRRGRSEAAGKTFEGLADRYLVEHARRFKRSASMDERNLRKHVLPKWGRRAFDQIERRDVIALVEGLITQGTPVLANRIQALVSTIFTFAVDADLVRANPCSRLRRRGVETACERVLSDEELLSFWTGILAQPLTPIAGLALRLVLLTGVRPGEAAGMRRDELEHIDQPERAGWTIAAERMKGKRAHYVPLSGMALETIREALRLSTKDQRFVFASPRGKGAIRATALPVVMQRFGGSLNLASPGAVSWKAFPPTPHDLRRTVATRLAGLGIPGEDVAAVLAHTLPGVTKAHYDRYDRAREKRRALESWAGRLEEIVKNPGITAHFFPSTQTVG